jgi:serine/threonine protein kinase
MHRHHIGHRDIKFENLLLSTAGDPVLVDFGSSGYGPRRTIPICTLTTRSVHLLALEQKGTTVVSGYDGRAVDVWSFAIMYLELLLQVRLLPPELYRKDAETILLYYRYRIPYLLDQLAARDDVSPHVSVLIRQSLLSASPGDQPLIEDFA